MKNQWLKRAKLRDDALCVWDQTELGDAVKKKYERVYLHIQELPGRTTVKPLRSLTGDDVLYVSNASGAIRLHLVNGGYVELRGTADEIADKIHELFMKGRNAS